MGWSSSMCFAHSWPRTDWIHSPVSNMIPQAWQECFLSAETEVISEHHWVWPKCTTPPQNKRIHFDLSYLHLVVSSIDMLFSQKKWKPSLENSWVDTHATHGHATQIWQSQEERMGRTTAQLKFQLLHLSSIITTLYMVLTHSRWISAEIPIWPNYSCAGIWADINRDFVE